MVGHEPWGFEIDDSHDYWVQNKDTQDWTRVTAGLFLDDIEIPELEYYDDGESSDGGWSIDLGPDETTVLVVSGRTRMATEPADYWYTIGGRPWSFLTW